MTDRAAAAAGSERWARRPREAVEIAVYGVFLLSGAAALVYQLAWQRVLFRIYGIDIASITVVVTAFMLGLGVGSLAGGALSRVVPGAALRLFASFEIGIGACGAASLPLLGGGGKRTAGAGHLATGGLTFDLVLVPTTLMGATLPLLADGSSSGRGTWDVRSRGFTSRTPSARPSARSWPSACCSAVWGSRGR
jgi:hypothetical protein